MSADLVLRLRAGAEDPMWDAHAEFPKKWLAEAAERIEADTALLRQALDALEEGDAHSRFAAIAALRARTEKT